MKISEVVRLLEIVKEKNGDVAVCVFEPRALVEGKQLEVEAFVTISLDLLGNFCAVIADRATVLGPYDGDSHGKDEVVEGKE